MNITFLLSINVFHGIDSEIFDNKYFNFFKQIDLKRNDFLFKFGEIRTDIFLLKKEKLKLNLMQILKN